MIRVFGGAPWGSKYPDFPVRFYPNERQTYWARLGLHNRLGAYCLILGQCFLAQGPVCWYLGWNSQAEWIETLGRAYDQGEVQKKRCMHGTQSRKRQGYKIRPEPLIQDSLCMMRHEESACTFDRLGCARVGLTASLFPHCKDQTFD
jgi:hypothetical protein